MQLTILIDKSWDLSDSAPLNWSQVHEIINLVVWIDDTLISRWEVWVSEHRASAVVLVQNGVKSVGVFVESTLHVCKRVENILKLIYMFYLWCA